jgi:NhaA family Na+:H+ antiporter
MTIPARTRINEDEFAHRAREALREFESACGPETTVLSSREQQEALHAIEQATDEAQAPLLKMEDGLHGWVAFGIMPLFALSNAGVRLSPELFATLSVPVTLGIVLGLVVGKPLGITLIAWLAVRGRVAAPPAAPWRTLHGVSWLGGIGFTMSLFIAGLAFTDAALLDSAKLGILAASIAAGLGGWLVLRRLGRGGGGEGSASEAMASPR